MGRWRCDGGGAVAVQAGNIYIYIYIYISETPSWFQSSDEESVRCNGMTGCRGGRGVILASSVVSSFCSAALQLHNKNIYIKKKKLVKCISEDYFHLT